MGFSGKKLLARPLKIRTSGLGDRLFAGVFDAERLLQLAIIVVRIKK
jgi:hypothetical protein